MRVVIVEDEPLILIDLEYLVEHAGWTVAAVATDAEEALAATMEHRPDLVIMDIALRGGTDGLEAARRIQAATETRVLFLTARTDRLTRAAALLLNPVAFVAKPFIRKDLVALLQCIAASAAAPRADWPRD